MHPTQKKMTWKKMTTCHLLLEGDCVKDDLKVALSENKILNYQYKSPIHLKVNLMTIQKRMMISMSRMVVIKVTDYP